VSKLGSDESNIHHKILPPFGGQIELAPDLLPGGCNNLDRTLLWVDLPPRGQLASLESELVLPPG
jgi:hypothetical protein